MATQRQGPMQQRRDQPVGPEQLRVTARIADVLVYAVGLVGAVAGALLLQTGDRVVAIAVWVATLLLGVFVLLLAWVARGVAQVLQEAREAREAAREAAQAAGDPPLPTSASGPAGPPDPYRRWNHH